MQSRGAAVVLRRGALHRDVVLALHAYATDHRDAHLYFHTPESPETPLFIHGAEVPWTYFPAASKLWPNFLDRSYLHLSRQALELGTEGVEAHNERLGRPKEVFVSPLLLSYCLFAHPDFFIGAPALRKDLLVGTHASQITAPSAKGITVEWSFRRVHTRASDAIIIGYADASVETPSGDAFNQRGLDLVQRPWGANPLPVLSTSAGLRGRDR